MPDMTEYKGHVIYELHQVCHIYRGTVHSFKSGDIPPFWLGYIRTFEGAKGMIDSFTKDQPQIVTTQRTKLLVKHVQEPLEARLVTVKNLEEIERWTSGSIKGTRLPREQRVIRWYDQNLEGSDMEARVGDWVIKFGYQGFAVYDETHFHKYFKEV